MRWGDILPYATSRYAAFARRQLSRFLFSQAARALALITSAGRAFASFRLLMPGGIRSIRPLGAHLMTHAAARELISRDAIFFIELPVTSFRRLYYIYFSIISLAAWHLKEVKFQHSRQ